MFWPTTSRPRRAALRPEYAVLSPPNVLTIGGSQGHVEDTGGAAAGVGIAAGVIGAALAAVDLRLLHEADGASQVVLVEVAQLADLVGELGHGSEVRGQDVGPGAVGSKRDELAQRDLA